MRGQVHWVQQADAVLHPGFLLSPRLGSYQRYFGQTPTRGMDRTGSRPAAWPRPRRRDINTRSGPKHRRRRGHTHSYPDQVTARSLTISSAAGREASLQRSWLRKRVQVIVAPK